MRIGFLGAGKNAQTISRHLLAAGNEVMLSNARGPETIAATVAGLGCGAYAGTREQALDTDLVILAVNWPDVQLALNGLNWTGKVLVDTTNAHSTRPPDLSAAGVARSVAALGDKTSSELVADWAPGARVVKSISNMPMNWISDFSAAKPRTVIFVAGDDAEANLLVVNLLDQAGFAAVYLGGLANGGALFQLGGPLSGLELHFVRRLRR